MLADVLFDNVPADPAQYFQLFKLTMINRPSDIDSVIVRPVYFTVQCCTVAIVVRVIWIMITIILQVLTTHS